MTHDDDDDGEISYLDALKPTNYIQDDHSWQKMC